VAVDDSSSVFLDTSVLLEGLIELRPEAAAQRIWTAIAQGRLSDVLTAWHCCLEFYSVATRLPEEYRLSPADAVRLLEHEVHRRLTVHGLPTRSRLPLLRSAAAERLAGGRIYDAHIGEIARAAGARIVATENRRHFTSLLRHGVRVLTAEELAAEAGVVES
jgi:predicted nucleic acid-binding protein